MIQLLLPLPLATLLLAGCDPPNKCAEESVANSKPESAQHGIATFHADQWIERKAANGEIYQAKDRTAAHRTPPVFIHPAAGGDCVGDNPDN